MHPSVRLATTADAAQVGRLLHDFNVEYAEPTPSSDALAKRITELLDGDEITILLADDGPDGLAALRFRPSIWSLALECYVAELYVIPDRRREGLGRALMLAAMDLARERGADNIDLGTAETDVAARALYESLGFRNLERPGGPIQYVYEREL